MDILKTDLEKKKITQRPSDNFTISKVFPKAMIKLIRNVALTCLSETKII